MHGANEARFRSFINRCLSNNFNTLHSKWRQEPLSDSRSFPFEVEYENGANDEFCHANSGFLKERERRTRERTERRLSLGEFVRHAEAAIPGLCRFVKAFGESGSWEETANLIGRKRCAFFRRSVRQIAARAGDLLRKGSLVGSRAASRRSAEKMPCSKG